MPYSLSFLPLLSIFSRLPLLSIFSPAFTAPFSSHHSFTKLFNSCIYPITRPSHLRSSRLPAFTLHLFCLCSLFSAFTPTFTLSLFCLYSPSFHAFLYSPYSPLSSLHLSLHITLSRSSSILASTP